MKTALALLLLCLPRLALAAGSVSFSTQQINQGGTAYMVTINWTGDASTGSVPTTTITGLNQVQGYVITQIQTVPGTPAPTAGYSITVKDVNGYDMAGGQASSLSATAAASFATTSATPPLVGSLSFALTGNSVASAKGKVVLYIYKPSVLAAANLLGRYGTGSTTPPAGSNKEVQYNDNGAFGAEAGFEYDPAANTLTVETLSTSGTSAGCVTLYEAAANGSNFTKQCSPDALSQDVTLRFPNASPAGSVVKYPTPSAGVSQGSYIVAAEVDGTPTTGNCVKWINSYTVGDQGSTCGGGTSVSATAPYLTIGGIAYIPDGMYAVTTPPASSWTALNSQTSSTGSQGEIIMTTVGTTNGSFYGFYRTITSNTLEAAIQCTGGSGGSTWRGGVGVRGSGGDMYIIGPNANAGQSPAIGFLKWTNETTQSGSVYDTVFVGGKITYLKVVNNGSSVTPYASFDGKTWMQMYDGGGGANNVTGTGWVFGVSGSGNGALNNTCILLSWKEY